MAGLPKELIEKPIPAEVGKLAIADSLSDVLRNIRLSGSLQFCFMPTGAWQTDATPALANLSGRPSSAIPFHIIVEGTCWMKLEDETIS